MDRGVTFAVPGPHDREEGAGLQSEVVNCKNGLNDVCAQQSVSIEGFKTFGLNCHSLMLPKAQSAWTTFSPASSFERRRMSAQSRPLGRSRWASWSSMSLRFRDSPRLAWSEHRGCHPSGRRQGPAFVEAVLFSYSDSGSGLMEMFSSASSFPSRRISARSRPLGPSLWTATKGQHLE